MGAPQLRARKFLPRGLSDAHPLSYSSATISHDLLGRAHLWCSGARVPSGILVLPQPLLLELFQRRRVPEHLLTKIVLPNKSNGGHVKCYFFYILLPHPAPEVAGAHKAAPPFPPSPPASGRTAIFTAAIMAPNGG